MVDQNLTDEELEEYRQDVAQRDFAYPIETDKFWKIINELLSHRKFREEHECDDPDTWTVTREDLRKLFQLHGSNNYVCDAVRILTDNEITSLDDLREDEEEEEEEPEYQSGDVIKDARTNEYRFVLDYWEEMKEEKRIRFKHKPTGILSGDEEYGSSGMNYVRKYWSKVGHFRPTEEALERVPEGERGELVICENPSYGGPDTQVFMAPFNDEACGVYVKAKCDSGSEVTLEEQYVERTGIVINFHQFAEKR